MDWIHDDVPKSSTSLCSSELGFAEETDLNPMAGGGSDQQLQFSSSY